MLDVDGQAEHRDPAVGFVAHGSSHLSRNVVGSISGSHAIGLIGFGDVLARHPPGDFGDVAGVFPGDSREATEDRLGVLPRIRESTAYLALVVPVGPVAEVDHRARSWPGRRLIAGRASGPYGGGSGFRRHAGCALIESTRPPPFPPEPDVTSGPVVSGAER